MIIIYNDATNEKWDINFDIPIPRVGETICFNFDLFEVQDVHYAIDLEQESYFIEITVKQKQQS